MTTLTEEVLAYQRAGRGLESLVSRVAEVVYHYPASRPGFSEEDSAEFLERFYPRIRSLVTRYRPTGSTFERYLRTTLRWQLRSFAIERSNSRVRLAAATHRSTASETTGHHPFALPCDHGAEAPDSHPHADSEAPVAPRREGPRPANRPSALPLAPGGPADIRLTPGEAQRFLCMALTANERLTADTFARVARVVGCDAAWLEDRRAELHELSGRTLARKAVMRDRRDRAWFRTRCLEARLNNAVPAEREELQRRRDHWQLRYERAREALARSARCPTHGQIAEALGIAKGTVDSSIFTFRRELASPAFRDRLARLMDAT